MPKTAIVSILMTTYNRASFVGDAIDSVLASTYQNWELIIVDDDSQDETVAIARSYQAKEPRIKLFTNSKNIGDYPNRNRAAGYASGKYLKYLDADDYVYPWGISALVDMMEKFPEAGLGLCTIKPDLSAPFPKYLYPRQAYTYHYLGPFPIFKRAPLSAIISRQAFEKVNGFSGDRYVGDFDLWHRLAKEFPVVLMPGGIVWYRSHDEQESKNHHQATAVYARLEKQHLFAPDCPLTPSERRQALRRRKWQQIKRIIKYLLLLKPALAFQHFRYWVVLTFTPANRAF